MGRISLSRRQCCVSTEGVREREGVSGMSEREAGRERERELVRKDEERERGSD